MQTTENSLNDSDDEIVERIRNGDVDSFERLLVRYRNHVLRIAYKHVPFDEAEETAHMAFIRAYRSLGTFKKRGAFKQWLSSIAVRTCYDFWRERYRSKEYAMSALSEQHEEWLENVTSAAADETFLEEGARKEAREVLDWALARLSPEDRMVMELVYLEELPVREAAALLGWTVANVKIRSFRSRKKLYALISGIMER